MVSCDAPATHREAGGRRAAEPRAGEAERAARAPGGDRLGNAAAVERTGRPARGRPARGADAGRSTAPRGLARLEGVHHGAAAHGRAARVARARHPPGTPPPPEAARLRAGAGTHTVGALGDPLPEPRSRLG